MRRIGSGIAVVFAAVVLVVEPAGAAVTSTTRSASAFWDVGDALQTRVSLQASEPAAGGDGSLFVFITQRYCDTATNETVFLSYSGQSTLTTSAFRVLPNLKSAQLHVATTLNKSESRSPDCVTPGNPTSFTNHGPVPVTIDVAWTGQGATYTVQPGVSGRNATATGTITGFAPLGTSQFAELRQSTQ